MHLQGRVLIVHSRVESRALPEVMDLVLPGCGSWAVGEVPVWVNYSLHRRPGQQQNKPELVWVLQGEQRQGKGLPRQCWVLQTGCATPAMASTGVDVAHGIGGG